MTHKIKNIGIGVVVGLVFIAAFGLFYTVKANPSYFVRSSNTSTVFPTATTTVAYLTPGAATTTLAFDLGVNGSQGADSAVLGIQFTASSSAGSILNVNFEYSQGGSGLDCVNSPTACDWYQDNLSGEATSTTGTNINITGARTVTWTYASTTPGLAASNATTSRDSRLVIVKSPTRYVRAVFTVPVGAKNGAVWAEFIGKRQAN